VIYDRHVGELFLWARSRVGNHAADLTAEVFARAWLQRRSFRELIQQARGVLEESTLKITGLPEAPRPHRPSGRVWQRPAQSA